MSTACAEQAAERRRVSAVQMPIRPHPRPGESLPGYLLRTAARFGMSPAGWLRAVGAEDHGPARTQLLSETSWTGDTLAPGVRATVMQSLGLTSAQFADLQGADFFSPRVPGTRRFRTHAAVCLDCLDADPHFWPLTWWSPWTFVCAKHRLVLQPCLRCWTGRAKPRRTTATHTCSRFHASKDAVDAQSAVGAFADGGATSADVEMIRLGSAATLLHRLDIADEHRQHGRSPATWQRRATFTDPQRMHDYLPTALTLLDDPKTQRQVRGRLLNHDAAIRKLTLHGLTLPDALRGSQGAGEKIGAPGVKVAHSAEWPHLLPVGPEVADLLERLGHPDLLTLRHVLVVLSMRNACGSYRASILAVGMPACSGSLHMLDTVVSRARQRGCLTHLREATVDMARRIDADAAIRRWGTRRHLLAVAACDLLTAARDHLDRHPAARLTDEDLRTWMWFAWANAHPNYRPGHSGDANQRRIWRLRAQHLEDKVGQPPAQLDRVLDAAYALSPNRHPKS